MSKAGPGELASYLASSLAAERRAGKDSGHNYLDYHRQRFEYVQALCIRFCANREAAVLDVGRHALSFLLANYYRHVWTVGFPLRDPCGPDGGLGPHLIYDLNDASTGREVETSQRFELIVFAETIEHLHTAPELVLFALRKLLKPGGIIVCQTPNAVALNRRLAMLAGRNPYERLRLDQRNPGHVREYTKAELFQIGRAAGLEPVYHAYRDYFGYQGGMARRMMVALLKLAARAVPSLSRGQTIVYRWSRSEVE